MPTGFTAVAAVELYPVDLHFSQPARLTLPLATPMPPGQLSILLHFNATTQTYEQVGLGRVSADGTRITSISGGLRQLSTVLFATTGAQATKVFLVPVAGNNQRVQPGEVLPEPLVVRLEDQFGNPVVGEAVAARIIRGEGVVVEADATTNAQGEARVRVQAGASDTDLVVAVAAPALPEVRPAQFFAVIGAFDTPGMPWTWWLPGTWCLSLMSVTVGCKSSTCRTPPAPCACTRCSAWDLGGPHIPRKCGAGRESALCRHLPAREPASPRHQSSPRPRLCGRPRWQRRAGCGAGERSAAHRPRRVCSRRRRGGSFMA